MTDDRYRELGRLFAGALEQGLRVFGGPPSPPAERPAASTVSDTATTCTNSNPISTSTCTAPACNGGAPASSTPTNAPGKVTNPTVRV